MKSILKVFLISFFAIIFFSSYILFVPLSSQGTKHIIDVSPGRSFFQVARELKQKNLIISEWAFKLLVVFFASPPLPFGEYEMSSGLSLWSQFHKMRKGQSRYDWVTFAEGLNSFEFVEILKRKKWPGTEEFEKLIKDKKFIQQVLDAPLPSLEGYLFPDTYRLYKYMSGRTLLKNMVREFLKVYEEVKGPLPFPMARHEIVTLASLIEKETSDSSERPLIASVFYNRLRKGMKLQTDPTILYSLFLAKGVMVNNIRKKDILFRSPYNTYVIKGLPPGPIANPGRKALEACFNPAETENLYFVSRNDGTHFFSTNYKDHSKAVYEYQIKPFRKSLNRLPRRKKNPKKGGG